MPITTKTGHNGRIYVSTNTKLEADYQVARAIKDGDWIFLNETSGTNYEDNTLSDDVALQAKQMLLNVKLVLEAVGATLSDIVRFEVFATDKPTWLIVKDTLRPFIAEVHPTTSLIFGPFAQPNIKVEVLVTAKVSSKG